MAGEKKLTLIDVSKIFILNPRERNEQVRLEIKKNIEDVGLKRPITVYRKKEPVDGFEYDLVCGQGRLEAYIANNEKQIPAIIINTDEEEALIMSLVENIARRNNNPSELLQGVKRLRDKGYSNIEIARRTGLSRDYISQIGTLIDKGETRLIDAVERQKVPLNIAIDIACSTDSDVQNMLQDAYEKNVLRGKKLSYVRRLIEQRKRNGKDIYRGGNNHKRMNPLDLNQMYEKEIEKRRILIRKAERVENILHILTQGFKVLYQDYNFRTLLRAERLENFPEYLMKRIKPDG